MPDNPEPAVYGPRAKAVARGLALSVAEQIEPEGHYVVVADSDATLSSALELVEQGVKVQAVVAWGLGAPQVARLTSTGIPVVIGLPTRKDWRHCAVDPAVVEALVPIEERMAKRRA